MSARAGNFCLPSALHGEQASDRTIVMQMHENQIADWSGTRSKPAWANVWHLWTVLIPRRTITGRLVCGKVWRRHDGRRWIYKRFVQWNDVDA